MKSRRQAEGVSVVDAVVSKGESITGDEGAFKSDILNFSQ